MATEITLSDLNAFPVVRGNTRTTRSFTEQNVANLISNLFVDMSNGNKKGFTVCKHDTDKVLFNLAGRFFDYQFTSGQSLWFGIIIDTTTGEIATAYSSEVDDFDNSVTYKLQILDSEGNLVNQIHLYVDESAQGNNSYQTKSQIDTTINNYKTSTLDNAYAPKTDSTVYATQTTVGNSEQSEASDGSLYQRVKYLQSHVSAIEAINTIDGGTIS